jgi:hypothetical protein
VPARLRECQRAALRPSNSAARIEFAPLTWTIALPSASQSACRRLEPLNESVVGVTSALGGTGYWLVASDGGVSAVFAGDRSLQHETWERGYTVAQASGSNKAF